MANELEFNIKEYGGTPLTAPKQQHEIHEDLRAKLSLVMVDNSHVLLISKKHSIDTDVRGFKRRMERVIEKLRIVEVDYSVIAQTYVESNRKQEVSSTMQAYATRLFKRATDLHASDIHIRINTQNTTILFGIYDEMVHHKDEYVEFGKQLCTAIYGAMADVADATYESLNRQDARISDKSKIGQNLDGIRIATSPQVGGQTMTLRLLYDDSNASHDVETMGYLPHQAKQLKSASKKPTGINIITGPTGAGKSTTLQRQLSQIMVDTNFRLNLITVEDPPEYKIAGAVQTPVTNANTEEERSHAFQDAILAAMRQAPKIIMTGEIRDAASASLAFRAAMTGHQVWTTLHTIGVFPTFARLKDLGVPDDLLFDPEIVTSITSQRLVKVLCDCKVPLLNNVERFAAEDIDRFEKTIKNIDHVFVKRDQDGVCGCERCNHTGTIGRKAVAEVLLPTPLLMRILRQQGREAGYRYWKEKMGGMTLRETLLLDIDKGIVDPFAAESVVGLLDFDPIAPEANEA